MRLPDDPSKYTSRFKYVEVGRIIENYQDSGKDKFIREQKYVNGKKKPLLIPVDEVQQYAEENGNLSIYRSIYQYDSPTYDEANSIGPLYFDLDSQDISLSHEDVIKIYNELIKYIPDEAIDIYFSGNKGFHLEIENLVLNIAVSDNLPKISSFIAHDFEKILGLNTIDYQVYDSRRMWRVPNTRHKTSGLYKVECKDEVLSSNLEAVFKKAEQPRPLPSKPEQKMDFNANKWFREYTYKYEQTLLPFRESQDLLTEFLETGTSRLRNFDYNHMQFNAYNLRKNCSAFRDIEKKAYKNNHLEHYERLFLCSLLTYTDDGIAALHTILQQLDDYSYTVSNAHIEDWIKRREYGIGGRPFTCAKAAEVGISCRDCHKLTPKRKSIMGPNGTLIETNEMASPSPVRFGYTVKPESI